MFNHAQFKSRSHDTAHIKILVFILQYLHQSHNVVCLEVQ